MPLFLFPLDDIEKASYCSHFPQQEVFFVILIFVILIFHLFTKRSVER